MFGAVFMLALLAPALVGLYTFSLLIQNGRGWFLFSAGSSLSLVLYKFNYNDERATSNLSLSTEEIIKHFSCSTQLSMKFILLNFCYFNIYELPQHEQFKAIFVCPRRIG